MPICLDFSLRPTYFSRLRDTGRARCSRAHRKIQKESIRGPQPKLQRPAKKGRKILILSSSIVTVQLTRVHAERS